MIIYLHRGMAHASAEREDTAARLEAQGWVRCTEEYHHALWMIGEVERYDELRAEARARVQTAPTKKTVYIVKEKVLP